jgi:hypothetical protein
MKKYFSYLIKRFARSFVYRSEIMIDISNRLKLEFFKDKVDENTFLQIKLIQTLIKNNFLQTKLLFLGKMNTDGTYPVVKYRDYKNKILLSFGVGNNIILEAHGAKLGMEVHTFDHTTSIKIPNKFKDKIYYHSVGVTGHKIIPGCLKLEHIMDLYNISHEKVEILKLDIEGCEWDVLISDLNFIKSFPQLIIEFHDLDKVTNQQQSSMYFNVLQRIFETHQLIYISPNNFSSFSHVNNLIWPFTFEAVFVARSILDDTFTGVFDPIKFVEDQVNNRDFGPKISLLSWWQ